MLGYSGCAHENVVVAALLFAVLEHWIDNVGLYADNAPDKPLRGSHQSSKHDPDRSGCRLVPGNDSERSGSGVQNAEPPSTILGR